MKHAASSDWTPVEKREPKHSAGWGATVLSLEAQAYRFGLSRIPGRHAKPFAKHHPATPVTYDAAGMTTPLVTAAPVVDVVA